MKWRGPCVDARTTNGEQEATRFDDQAKAAGSQYPFQRGNAFRLGFPSRSTCKQTDYGP